MENIFKFRQYIFAISLLFALGKRRALHLKRLETYLFVPSLIETDQVVLEKNIFFKFRSLQTDSRTDDGRQAIKKALFSFPLKSAKKERICFDKKI